jgi:hypothetical protein
MPFSEVQRCRRADNVVQGWCATDRKSLLAFSLRIDVAAVSSRSWGVAKPAMGTSPLQISNASMARQTFDAIFKLKLGPEVKLPPEGWT